MPAKAGGKEDTQIKERETDACESRFKQAMRYVADAGRIWTSRKKFEQEVRRCEYDNEVVKVIRNTELFDPTNIYRLGERKYKRPRAKEKQR